MAVIISVLCQGKTVKLPVFSAQHLARTEAEALCVSEVIIYPTCYIYKQMIFFFFFKILLKSSCFTMLCYFLLYSKVN